MITYRGSNKGNHRQRNPIAVHVKVLTVCNTFVAGIPEESLVQDLLNEAVSEHAGAGHRVLMSERRHPHAHLFHW